MVDASDTLTFYERKIRFFQDLTNGLTVKKGPPITCVRALL